MSTNDNTEFKATLELSQTGLDGEIFTKVTFHPLVSGDDINLVPGAYQILSHLIEYYLQLSGLVDEDGDLIEGESLASVEFDVQPRAPLN